jgi:hypothetical protein
MPFYIYVKEGDESGESAREEFYPISDFQQRRQFDGEWYVVSGALQQRQMSCGVGTAKDGEKCYPFYSSAMGVHPSQIQECQEVYRRAGLGVQEFDNSGDVKVNDPWHYRRLRKARGFVHRNSYYG